MSITAEYIDPPEVSTKVDKSDLPEIKPFNVWRPSQFLTWQEPPGNHVMLPAYMTRSEITALIGQGGLGKSRLALYMAVCQILGRPWCGFEMWQEPLLWLFLGNENSIARLKQDLEKMFSALTAEEKEKLDLYLRLPAIQDLDDMDLCLRDPNVQARLTATITEHSPDVIVADPLANMAPGDISKPGEMKEAVRLISTIVRRAAPRAALELLHHARTGRGNIAQGVGYDAGNFASGGKALFASARCVMNLMPGKEHDESRLVLSCAKSNNCQRFETRGLVLNRETFAYDIDPDFDLGAWQAEVEGRARSGQSLCTIAEVVSAVADGHRKTKDLVATLMDECATPKRTVERTITKAVDCEAIKALRRGEYILGRKSAKYATATT